MGTLMTNGHGFENALLSLSDLWNEEAGMGAIAAVGISRPAGRDTSNRENC